MLTPTVPPSLPTFPLPNAVGSPAILSAGIVAHNEERNVERAVRSLLDQNLPSGVRWKNLWIVASGCTDRTVEVANRLAEKDPRVRVITEPDRMGKAHALQEVFRRAEGDAVVLLNSDAQAEPGAVGELVRVGLAQPTPFAVMGRPVVLPGTQGPWTEALRSMWELHHNFHLELQREGGGTHLSDELLLVSLSERPPLPAGIINDGSYIATWLAQHGGRRLYAPNARVMIEVPHRVRDHLRQRRRIKVGNEQVTSVLGAAPSTLIAYALRSPARALALVRQSVLSERNGLFRLAWLGASETAAKALAVWDRVPPRKDHVRWQRIEGATALAPTRPPLDTSESGARNGAEIGLELRVAALIESAGAFGTGLSLEDLVTLLPRDGPATPEAMRRWLATRPSIGRIEGDRIFSPQVPPISVEARRARGLDYRSLARAVIHRLAPERRFRSSAASGSPGRRRTGNLKPGTTSIFWSSPEPEPRGSFSATRTSSSDSDERWPGEPDLCFNFVLDDIEAPREFARGRGFLYAREALTTGILWGEEDLSSLARIGPLDGGGASPSVRRTGRRRRTTPTSRLTGPAAMGERVPLPFR